MSSPLSLNKLAHYTPPAGPVLLIIMDGVGIGADLPNNAVYMANTPFLDQNRSLPTFRLLKAHGLAVGMPSDEDMGNSEVGHNALGAGRIFDQGASLVQRAIADQSLFKGEVWNNLLTNVKTYESTLHFIGLLSDGNVHAHIDHLLEMLHQAFISGVLRGRVHVLLDGRDVDQKSALRYLAKLDLVLADINGKGGDYAIASGGGRMVTTMDRYNADWSIVERGWQAHVLGQGRCFDSAKQAVETFYTEDPNMTDQYLPAFVITQNSEPLGPILDHDGVIMFNFRGDRAIELSMAFEQTHFNHFDRQRVPHVFFAGMMQYDGDLKIPTHYLVNPPVIESPISAYLCANQVTSFAISETQKYGHVTYFWNGNRSGYLNVDLEKYIEIPSDRIPFDQVPEMKAFEITEETIRLLQTGDFQFGRVNFPNGDMVGHTGVMFAAVRACEVTDACVAKLVAQVNALGGVAVVLADHGNADEMFSDQNGVRTPKTAHTLAPVPFFICDSRTEPGYVLRSDLPNAGLSNVAATLCELLGYCAPQEYEPSLIQII